MADSVQIFDPTGASGAVAFGLADAMDNHGNLTSGFSLKCNGKAPVEMGWMDWAWLSNQIGSHHDFSFSGNVPFEAVSPLQQLCNKAAAKTR